MFLDSLVLGVAVPGVLHLAGHHHAALHVLLRPDPHPVVSQVLNGRDEVQLHALFFEVTMKKQKLNWIIWTIKIFRFFSLFGGSFSRHWERPPPTYDESLKHINPDLQQRPPDPPPYSESFRARSVIVMKTVNNNNNPRFPLSRSLLALRSSQTGPSSSSPTSQVDISSRSSKI